MNKFLVSFAEEEQAIRDMDVMKYAEQKWQDYLKDEIKYFVFTSNELVVLAFRVLVKEGVIPHDKIEFSGGGTYPINIDSKGRFINPPSDFCELHESLLDRLL